MRITEKQIAAWRERWTEALLEDFHRQLSSGVALGPEHSPFGVVDGRGDFRGLALRECALYRNRCVLDKLDFSGGVFTHTWIENFEAYNCIFGKTDFEDTSEHQCHFEQCQFYGTLFRLSGIGYDHSKYKRCIFQRASFARAVFCCAEYDDCLFDNCKLGGVDFDGSSFERCKFVGKVHNVWFRGEMTPSLAKERNPNARRNRMFQVDFSEADFRDLTLSDGCDLSSILIPEDGSVLLFDRASERLNRVIGQSKGWGGLEAKFAKIYARSCLRPNQEWLLVSRQEILDYTRKHATEELGYKILDVLSTH